MIMDNMECRSLSCCPDRCRTVPGSLSLSEFLTAVDQAIAEEVANVDTKVFPTKTGYAGLPPAAGQAAPWP